MGVDVGARAALAARPGVAGKGDRVALRHRVADRYLDRVGLGAPVRCVRLVACIALAQLQVVLVVGLLIRPVRKPRQRLGEGIVAVRLGPVPERKKKAKNKKRKRKRKKQKKEKEKKRK